VKTGNPLTVHFIHKDGHGGGERSAADWIEIALEFGGARVLHGSNGFLGEWCNRNGVPHRSIATDRKGRVPLGLCQLTAELARLRPALAVMHGQWAGPVGTIACGATGTPFIYIARWCAFHTDRGIVRTALNRWCERIPCSRARSVVCLSESTRKQFLDRGLCPADRAVVIPNMFRRADLTPPCSRADCRRQLGWTAAGMYVVSAGRLEEEKNYPALLRSWPVVLAAHPSAQLWILGSGSLDRELKALANKMEISGSVHFAGRVDDVMRWFTAADVAVFASRYESFGRAAVEAMACGTPVVATLVDGLKDTVIHGQTGLLVPEGDPAKIAAAVCSLLGDAATSSRLGEAGRLRALEFDFERISPLVRDLIAAALRTASPDETGN